MTALEYITKAIATNKVKDFYPECRQVALDIYYLLNIHIQGIKPRYRNLRLYSDAANVTGGGSTYIEFAGGVGASRQKQWITPTGWLPKYQPYFENEILNRYPTMREERFHWQCSVYPKFPQSLFLQAIDEIRGAIFQESNYDYEFANENTETYCKAKNFEGLDIYDYITDILTPAIVNDPNGFIVVYPDDFYEPKDEQATDEDAGLPELEYVCSEQVLFFNTDVLAWHESKGAFIVDSEAYYFIPFDAKEKKYKAGEAIVLPHTLGVAPFRQLGGYKMYSKDLGHYYLSYFSGAIDWANVAVRDYLDVQAAKKDLIPITQQIEIECNTCHGVGSVPTLCEDGSAGCSESCSSCNGRGTISRNLGDVITVDRQDVVDGKMPDYLRYISADVASLEAMSKEFDALYKRFQEALYLKFSDLAQSGIAKEMDREKLYKFLQSFSNNLFNCVTDVLVFIDGLLNNIEINYSNVSVKRPSQFKLKSDSDLRDELRQLQSAGADEIAVKTVSDSLTMLASETTVTEKKIETLSLYDPMRYKADQQKTNLVIVGGAFTKADLVRSARASNELDRIIHQYGNTWFLQASYETLRAMLDNAMQPYLEQLNNEPVLMP
jgi:hypothetical protein